MDLDDKSQKSQKNRKNYSCEICDYTTPNKYDYHKHTLTAKHSSGKTKSTNNFVFKSPDDSKTQYVCSLCEKTYKTRSGFAYHKTRCTQAGLDESDEVSHRMDTSLVIELLKQNQEFKQLMIEQSKQLAYQQYQNQMLLEQQQVQNSHLLEAVKAGKFGIHCCLFLSNVG